MVSIFRKWNFLTVRRIHSTRQVGQPKFRERGITWKNV